MPSKNIGTIEHINVFTGEVISRLNKVYTKQSEKFIMIRTTGGLDWYFPLSKNEKSLILMLHDWSDSVSMRISLSSWQREYICITLGIERRMLSVLLRGLGERDCIYRLSQNDFMVNPSHAFKCSTMLVRGMIKEYELIKTRNL